MTTQPRAALAAVAAVHVLVLFLWDDPPPIYDEAGYLAAGEAVARWVRCGAGVWSGDACATASAASLGRLAWHNPLYSALFPVAALLPGPAAAWIRIVQVVAGIGAGAATWAVLRRWTSPTAAGLGAAIVWLHPVQIFFRLTLWPVAIATSLSAVAVLAVVRLHERPRSERRLRQLGLALLGLVFAWPSALVLTPFLALWLRRIGGTGRVLTPLLVVWLPWMIVASLVLGRPTAMDLAAAENAALGNNPWIASGRGSALHDLDAVQRLRFEAAVGCPGEAGLDRLRCEAAAYDAIARGTILDDPAGAAARAVLRFGETWRPDDFVARHLTDPRVVGPTRPPAAAAIVVGVELIEAVTLFAMLVACMGALRDPRAALLVGAILIATAPVLFTVGLTRLRQPMLPWIVMAAILTVSQARRRTYTRRP